MDTSAGQSSSSYADKFVRDRILPRMRKNAIISLGETSGPNYISLAPSTQDGEQKKKMKTKASKKPRLLPQFRGQTSRQLRALMRKQQVTDSQAMTCPKQLPERLHALWTDYADSLIDWEGFDRTAGNVTSRLENILRMDLLGARLRVMRSICTKQVDLEGIVVMETKNIFYLSVSCDPVEQETRLHAVPKRGTIFLLIMTRAEVAINGNCLMHRAIDRALRKWRNNPMLSGGAKQKRQPIHTDLFTDLLFRHDAASQ